VGVCQCISVLACDHMQQPNACRVLHRAYCLAWCFAQQLLGCGAAPGPPPPMLCPYHDYIEGRKVCAMLLNGTCTASAA
jgi:hypothetical protein